MNLKIECIIWIYWYYYQYNPKIQNGIITGMKSESSTLFNQIIFHLHHHQTHIHMYTCWEEKSKGIIIFLFSSSCKHSNKSENKLNEIFPSSPFPLAAFSLTSKWYLHYNPPPNHLLHLVWDFIMLQPSEEREREGEVGWKKMRMRMKKERNRDDKTMRCITISLFDRKKK